MKGYTKAIIIFGVALLVLTIAAMVYFVSAKSCMNAITEKVSLAFNAATFVNASEIRTDPSEAVIASCEDWRTVVHPDNYKAVRYYLLSKHAIPLFAHVEKEGALTISVCGDLTFYVQPDPDGNGANVLLESSEKNYIMHIAANSLYPNLLSACRDGTYAARNIPLDPAGE
jgi:hypothetical protein